ncbi:ribosomal L28e/Mak16 [Fomitopsis serialis]|uniref:ribosomal L28e/Mak16 n=1 Tax=Fomitopsis serialis TaxID=139415 RepID=UPI002008D983|nr:ribosomal L28e/Mak16 [Neoantrodia serialis]KAH9926430.1 ribosomal L28e/Mak16 [Neoantrodia serialis]
MSNDLEWLLLRKNNSFIVKRVAEGPIFSKEPANLTNIHSWKYSGLANSKTIAVTDSESGIKITTRKTKASPNGVRPAYATSTVRNRSGGRRAVGVAAGLAKRSYRPDLREATVARVSAILATQQEKKPYPPKKTRGKRRTEA